MTEWQKIRYEIQGNLLFVFFNESKFVTSESVEETGSELLALVKLIDSNSIREVRLDLSSVVFLSSAALNKLLLFHNSLLNLKVDFFLYNLRKELLEVFNITRLDQLFRIKRDSDDDSSEPEGLGGSRVPRPDRPTPGSLGAAKKLGGND